MKEVTDPLILEELNSKEVTDPAILAQLEGKETLKPESKSLGGFAGNILESGIEYGKNIAGVVTSPIQTIKNIAGVPRGIGHLIAEKMGAALTPDEQKYANQVRSIGDMYAERFGGWDKVVETAYKDPVGFTADVSTLFSGAGAGLKAGRLAKTGKIVGKVGRAVEPMNVLTAPVKAGLKLIPESAELRLYSSAIKGLTGKKISWEEKQDILRKGIEKGVFPNERGLNRLGDKIESLTNKFDETVVRNAGKTIKSDMVLTYLDELEDFYRAMPDPTDDLAAIAKIKKEFLASHGIEIGAKSVMIKVPTQINTGILDAKGNPIFKTILKDKIKNIPGKMEIPVEEAMDIKRAAYAKYRDAYGDLSTAAKEANKNIARGIKEEFIKMNPELKKVGQNEKAMIGLQDAIEAGLKRSQNYDIGRFPGLIAAGAVGATTGSGKLAAAVYAAKALIDTPVIKTALSVALNRAREISFAPKGTTTLRQTLYQAGKLQPSIFTYNPQTGKIEPKQ